MGRSTVHFAENKTNYTSEQSQVYNYIFGYMKKIILLTLGIFTLTGSSAREFHLAKSGNDAQECSVLQPFLSIFRVVQHAMPGDTITVHTGTYTEWVNPMRGGVSDEKRIVYG
jgi:hypothetical protein